MPRSFFFFCCSPNKLCIFWVQKDHKTSLSTILYLWSLYCDFRNLLLKENSQNAFLFYLNAKRFHLWTFLYIYMQIVSFFYVLLLKEQKTCFASGILFPLCALRKQIIYYWLLRNSCKELHGKPVPVFQTLMWKNTLKKNLLLEN